MTSFYRQKYFKGKYFLANIFFIIISVKFAANLLNTFSLICLFLVVLAGPIKSNKFIQSSLLDNLP